MPAQKSSVEVYKFGGASLNDAAAFVHAASIVKACRNPVVVVCSAPFGVTDDLLAVATAAHDGQADKLTRALAALRKRFATLLKGLPLSASALKTLGNTITESIDELQSIAKGLLALGELTPRTSDLIVSRGEMLGARMFQATLAAKRIKSQWVDPRTLIKTTGPFAAANPDFVLTDKAARKVLAPLLRQGVVPVVPGFLGALQERGKKEESLATLGRGGSDLTATLLARALGATRVSLWKDVSGLMTADPRVVSNARVVPQLNVREAAELAYYGAKVLHPRALIPISRKNIPLHVRPFGNPESLGTEISSRHTLDRYPVKALSAAGDQALITVAGRGLLGVPGVVARAFAVLSQHGISVSLISQSSSEQTICFTVPGGQADTAQSYLQEAFARELERGEVDGILKLPDVATIAVVGLGMAGHVGIAARVFGALAAGNVNLIAIAQGSSELNISFVVAADQSALAQRRIHDAFQLAKIGGGALHGHNNVDLVLLGHGQIGRTLATLVAKGEGRRKNSGAPVDNLRLVSAIDRQGFVFKAEGFSDKDVLALNRHKKSGKSFASFKGGHRGGAKDAVRFLGKHALSRPVIADVTADDTTAVLMDALDAGMDIVLANKKPLSGPTKEHDAFRAKIAEQGRRLRCEATVGAGLPILDTYRKLVESGDEVLKIEGCVSGTLGYLLTELGREVPFSQAVAAAKAKGYTEPDPRDDLSGTDVGRKALILGRLMGFKGGPASVKVESLVPASARKLTSEQFMKRLPEWDAHWAKVVASATAQGMVLRYVASVTRSKITVGLQKVKRGTPFASLEGTDNQIAFTTERYKSPLVVTGAGAGLEVTAGGVLNDVLDLLV